MRTGMAQATTGRTTQRAANNALSRSREDARSRDHAPGEAHTHNAMSAKKEGSTGGTTGSPSQ